MAFQPEKAFDRVPGQEQFQAFLEQARRGRFAQQWRQLGNRCGGGVVDPEAELCGQPHRTQHPDRIFTIPLFGIADQLEQAIFHILESTGVIANRKVIDRVVQRIGSEIAPDRVVLDRAENVVAQQPPPFVQLPVSAAVVNIGAERRDLDDLATEDDMSDAKTTPDQARIAKQVAHLLGRRARRDVEILRVATHEQVAHRAADQITGVTGIAQAVQHAQCVRADVLARDRMRVARNRP